MENMQREDIKQEIEKIALIRGYSEVNRCLFQKLKLEAMRDLGIWRYVKKEKIEAKIIEEGIVNGIRKVTYDYIPPMSEKPRVTEISVDSIDIGKIYPSDAPSWCGMGVDDAELADVWDYHLVSHTPAGRIREQNNIEDLPLFTKKAA